MKIQTTNIHWDHLNNNMIVGDKNKFIISQTNGKQGWQLVSSKVWPQHFVYFKEAIEYAEKLKENEL